MAKDPTKSSLRARTEDLRREIETATGNAVWQQPRKLRNFAWAILVWAVFVAVVGLVAAWTREQPRVAAGRIMTTTEVAGVRFSCDDPAATEQARTMAKAQAPRVYNEIPGVLAELRDGLEKLPLIAQESSTLESVEPGLRKQFGLTEDALAALRREVGDTEISAAWRDRVSQLVDQLASHPLVPKEAAQLESQALTKEMSLHPDRKDAAPILVPSANMINAEAQDLAQHLRPLVRDAGFELPLQDVVLARLTQPTKPTYSFDAAATAAAQDLAAANVGSKSLTYPETDAIYRRGDILTPAQVNVVQRAMEARRSVLPLEQLWGSRIAVVGVVGAIAIAMLGYTVLFVPRIRRNPARMAAIAALLGGAAILACIASAQLPQMIALTAVAPTVFCAVVLCIAYSQRIAIAYGALHGLLVCAGLGLPVGMFAVLVCGIGAAIWRLKEIRDRDTLIKAGVSMGVVLALSTMLVTLVELPINPASLIQAAKDAGWAGFAGLLVAGIALFILPFMERTFAITTGLTLIELRDPKQPLLRQLQQRAPGTYNHSLNLAALGEAAAEAIGADGLLTYVGALYHDIGKMNKPDYFVENQTPGFNRHDKLSPAMSLLIIVGHVKDGLELAREFGLPRPLWHFIESHHGTTLVEYFFHRAKKTAEKQARANGQSGDDDDGPSELEYRYPGPKPRTKEAAIIMICDAVESAARAMADPTPSRIDALVRAIATKRLMDGQFDECDLTLRDLNLIVEAVSRTLASIYHGRIAYPGDQAAGAASKAVVPVAGTIGERNGNAAKPEVKPREPVRT
jgi:putative nucleotidyltransferase with HDIG domain